ncbi:MAG: sensor histidine kinase [Sandaracinaceae bacterium]|nr:sensor histidine kinase [Sandaracinaceae bacterium]
MSSSHEPALGNAASAGGGAITGTLRERLAPLLVIFGALFAVSAPLAFFVMGANELDERGHTLALQAAETLARYAEEQPVLWRYDSLKLVEHLRYFEAQANVVRIDVVDASGVPIDAGSYEVPDEPLAWASAPIEVGGRRIGTVWVGSGRASLRRRALALLAGFTLLAVALAFLVYVIALRNARVAEERIATLVERLAARSMEERVRALRLGAIAAQEEDRRAIARDLHDSVAQSLTAIRIQTEVLSAHLSKPGEEARASAGTITQGIAKATDATIEEVRRALARLRPAALDEIGLEAAIHRAIDDAREHLGVEVVRELVLDRALSTTVETAVYRIVQEALTNVVRHARSATEVRVRVVTDAELVRIEIEDDGVGLAPREGHEGRGLRGMRERAELLGGRFDVEARSPRGTRVWAEIPVVP